MHTVAAIILTVAPILMSILAFVLGYRRGLVKGVEVGRQHHRSARIIGVALLIGVLATGCSDPPPAPQATAAPSRAAAPSPPTPPPTPPPNTSEQPPAPRQTCCKVCTSSQACGDSCISSGKTCRQAPGCACDR